MIRKSFLSAFLASLVAAALPAAATGILPAPAPVPVPVPVVSSWTGGYVGGSLGYFSGQSTVCVDGFVGYECDPGPTLPDLPEPSPEGAVVGISAGYDWQRGNLVYGIAGDLLFGDLSDSAPTSGTYGCADGCLLDVNSIAMLRGRIGYAANDSLLTYVTAGIAASNVSLNFEGGTIGPNDGVFANGIVGIGGEYRLTDQVSFGLEYLHFIESEGDVLFRSTTCPTCGVTNYSADLLRVTLAYRF